MSNQLAEILALLRREIWEKRKLFAGLFFIISLSLLAVGWYWPKTYSSFSTILVDEYNILRPLLEGTAETTTVVDRAALAKQIIFSRKAMEQVFRNTSYLPEDLSGLEKEQIMQEVEKRTSVENAGKNLIKISYSDKDPQVAFEIVQEITNVFISNSIEAKQKESQDSYGFIDSQVLEYQNKLQAQEQALKEFQSANIDARPGTQDAVSARIVDLQRRMEATKLEIRELEIRKETLKKQLSGEAAVTETLTRVGQYRERLAVLEEQLSNLRLSYHDTYPDIVRLKGQIESLKDSISEEQQREASGEQRGDKITNAAANSVLYRELRSQLSTAETQLASLYARLDETAEMLSSEQERIIRINEVEARLSEVMRGYEVDQAKYQQLLSVRENARISMNIDKQNQGLTFKIQDPAALQLTSEGIRYMHFMAAGMVLSFSMPLGLIYGLTLIDNKIRTSRTITEEMGLPVLASVYNVNVRREYDLGSFSKSIIFATILLCCLAYFVVGWLKMSG